MHLLFILDLNCLRIKSKHKFFALHTNEGKFLYFENAPTLLSHFKNKPVPTSVFKNNESISSPHCQVSFV